MLDAFKIKPFDLEPVYASWKDAPQFIGNPKKDLPVDEWLEKIRLGCIERHVPEEYWYKVAQHYMGPKAKARLDELKQVVAKVHGGKYRWTWKKFKVAMQNMGWGIDQDATQTIKVQGKSSGLWFMRKKDDEPAPAQAPPTQTPVKEQTKRAPPARSNTSFWVTRKPSVADSQVQHVEEPAQTRRPPKRSATDSSFWPIRRNSASPSDDTLSRRPEPHKAKSDSTVVATRPHSKSRSRSNSSESGEVTTVTQAPVWLLNACTALEYITSEHPKTMSILSAILITAGSIPSLPVISAGAGGAILASGTAHAIGAIAVGLGQALGATVKNSQDQHPHASTATH